MEGKKNWEVVLGGRIVAAAAVNFGVVIVGECTVSKIIMKQTTSQFFESLFSCSFERAHQAIRYLNALPR